MKIFEKFYKPDDKKGSLVAETSVAKKLTAIGTGAAVLASGAGNALAENHSLDNLESKKLPHEYKGSQPSKTIPERAIEKGIRIDTKSVEEPLSKKPPIGYTTTPDGDFVISNNPDDWRHSKQSLSKENTSYTVKSSGKKSKTVPIAVNTPHWVRPDNKQSPHDANVPNSGKTNPVWINPGTGKKYSPDDNTSRNTFNPRNNPKNIPSDGYNAADFVTIQGKVHPIEEKDRVRTPDDAMTPEEVDEQLNSLYDKIDSSFPEEIPLIPNDEIPLSENDTSDDSTYNLQNKKKHSDNKKGGTPSLKSLKKEKKRHYPTALAGSQRTNVLEIPTNPEQIESLIIETIQTLAELLKKAPNMLTKEHRTKLLDLAMTAFKKENTDNESRLRSIVNSKNKQ